MDKKQIFNSFFDTIVEFSDKDFQEKIWIKGLGPECSSFEEAICHFFDEGEGIFKSYKDYGISDKNYRLLLELSKKLRAFLNKIPIQPDPHDILIDPKWHEIQKLAKKVLITFNYKK